MEMEMHKINNGLKLKAKLLKLMAYSSLLIKTNLLRKGMMES